MWGQQWSTYSTLSMIRFEAPVRELRCVDEFVLTQSILPIVTVAQLRARARRWSAILSRLAGLCLFMAVVLGYPIVSDAKEMFRVFEVQGRDAWGSRIVAVDDGYLIVGGRVDRLTSLQTGLVIRTDHEGNRQFMRTIGDEMANSVFSTGKEIGKKDFILAGYAKAIRKPEFQAGSFTASEGWVVSVSSAGPTKWIRRLQWTEAVEYESETVSIRPPVFISDLDINRNGDIILVGHIRYGVSDQPVLWKLRSDGKLLWKRRLRIGDEAESVVPDRIRFRSSGGLLFSGTVIGRKQSSSGISGVVCSLNDSGNVLWKKRVDCSSRSVVEELPNGNIVAAMLQGHANKAKLHMMMLTGRREVIWERDVPLAGACGLDHLSPSDDERVIVAGSTCQDERERIWVIEVTKAGDLYSVEKHLRNTDVHVGQVITEGDHVFATGSRNKGNAAVWLYRDELHHAKVGANGNNTGSESKVHPYDLQ